MNIVLPSLSLTVPAWLHRPHIVVIGILVVGSMLGFAFHALCQATFDIFFWISAYTQPRWQPYMTRLDQAWDALEFWMRNHWTAFKACATQARATLSAGLVLVTPALRTVAASLRVQAETHSAALTFMTILSLSFAVWVSNRDFANTLSTLITTATDLDAAVLSLVFRCIRAATRISIWFAHQFVYLHHVLEKASLDGKR